MSNIPIETYNKMKTEYLNYRNQSEETLKEYQKTIKVLRENNDTLKRENHKIKIEQSSKDQSKEIKKLKEDKQILSRQIMDLESEAIAFKDKPIDSLLADKNALESFSLSFTNNNSVNKQVIKDNLKNKNEEILILKNELVKKEKAVLELLKKEKAKESYLLILKPNKKIDGVSLYRNKSDNDLIKTIIVKNVRKYFEPGTTQKKVGKEEVKGRMVSNNKNQIKKPEEFKQGNINVSNMNKKKFEELNISLENDIDDDNHSTLQKNISLEIKNILEEKRNFILQTMTYENFSFDLLPNHRSQNKQAITQSMNNSNNANQQSTASTRITQDIDLMIDKIKKRKEIVDSQRKKLEKVLNQYEINMS